MQQIISETTYNNPEMTCLTEEANKYDNLKLYYDTRPNKLLETTAIKTIDYEITQKVN